MSGAEALCMFRDLGQSGPSLVKGVSQCEAATLGNAPQEGRAERRGDPRKGRGREAGRAGTEPLGMSEPCTVVCS